MTTDPQKAELLEDFQSFLQQADQDYLLSPNHQPDLNTLLSELTSLKTEVKTESRQFKNTLDTLKISLETTQDNNHALHLKHNEVKKLVEQQHQETIRAMLLEIIDIYDHLNSGITVLQKYQPVNALFKHSQTKDIHFIERFKEGQRMTLKRFEQLLQHYQVKSINCIGQLLDPVTMIAIETEGHNDLANGIVLEELRQGFLYQDQVLRLAEVKVNKK